MPSKSKRKQKPSGSNTNRNGGPKTSTSNSTSVSVLPENRISKWTPEAITEKLKQREESFRVRRKDIELLKGSANQLYQAANYQAARISYTRILDVYGGNPTIFSNLAQTLLKLERYEEAEEMASEALKREPSNVKARFRRALARKGRKLYIAALADISTVLSADPTREDARCEQREITRLINEHTQGSNEPYLDFAAVNEDGHKLDDPDFPPFHSPPLILEEDDVVSDTEDAKHNPLKGACKLYNHGTCTEGTKCGFSHAPDRKSYRDKLGRNVCNDYLLGDCPEGEKCHYLHDKTYLSDGWWDHEVVVAKGKTLFEYNLGPQDFGSQLKVAVARAIRDEERDAGVVPSFEGKRSSYLLAKAESANHIATDSVVPDPTKPSDSDRPIVLVLALDYGVNADFQKPTLDAMGANAVVKIVNATTDAYTLLPSPNLVGIVATDGAIAAPEYSILLGRIIDYVKAGGRLVLTGGFSTHVLFPHANLLFQKFGLPWKYGSYYRTTHVLNQCSLLCEQNTTFEESYSMKANDLTGVAAEHVVYSPDKDNDSYLPGRNNPVIAYAPVERGWLGFIGDVNWEQGSIPVLVAMLGPPQNFMGRPLSTTDQHISSPSITPCYSRNLPSPDFIRLLPIKSSSDFPIKHKRFLSALGKKFNYEQAINDSAALALIASPNLKGIFITDDAIIEYRHLAISVKVIQYAKKGGNVVFGASFGRAHYALTTNYFQRASSWELEWDINGCDRVTGVLNVNHDLAKSCPNFPKAYTMTAAVVTGAPLKDLLIISYTKVAKMFGYDDDSDDEDISDDEESEWTDDGSDGSDDLLTKYDVESLVVRSKFGMGTASFVGDINIEEGTIEVLLGLLSSTNSPKQPSPTIKAPIITSSPSTSAIVSEIMSAISASGAASNKPKARTKPFALILSFEHADEFASKHAYFLHVIDRAGLEPINGVSVQRALELMDSQELVSIFVPYADIIKPEHADLVSKLVKFNKSGGSVVFGGYFASCIKPEEVEPFFRKFGLKWKAEADSLVTAKVITNPKSAFAKEHCPKTLSHSEHITALQISGFRREYEPIYITEAQSRKPRISRSPAIFTRVGQGVLGYVGETTISALHITLVLLLLREP